MLHTGDVSFDADGRSYTLRYSMDAICNLEAACDGRGIVRLSQDLADPEKVSVTLLRKVLWAGLREHHPEIDVKAAGELITAAGGLMTMIGHVGKALEAAFPASAEGDTARPQTPVQVGTGPASSEAGSRAA